MAHISKDERGGRVRWRARYLDPTGQAKEKTFARQVDAQRFLTGIEASKLSGDYVDPSQGRRPFREVAAEWVEVQVHDPSTQEQVLFQLRNHILPFFADRPIGSIKPSHLQAFIAGLTKKLAPSTIMGVYQHTSAIFKMAVRDGVIAKTPCVDIKLPAVDRPQVTPPTVEEVWRIHAAMPDRYRALILVGAAAGLRQGEALGLTVGNVDFLRREIRVVQQLKLVVGREPFLAPPKTSASHRTIPVPELVTEALAAHLAASPATLEMTGVSGRSELLIFTNAAGGPIRRTGFGEVWRPAVKRAGVAEGVSFHDLRHFYASALIRQGLSVRAVQARLGHKSATETLNTYAHLWPDDEDLTRAAVAAVLSPLTGHRRDEQVT